MKLFSAAILALLSPAAVYGTSYATCAKQKPCVSFTVNQVDSTLCDDDCYYDICMT
jgi:hypothetical protein